METVILENLSKCFRTPRHEEKWAVRQLNLSVQQGELLVLVGPSGCGKTTTLRLVAGLEEPTQGEIILEGRSMKGIAPKDRGAAMVLQNPSLFPHMTAGQNLAFALQLRKTSKSEIPNRVRETAQLIGLGNELDRHPRDLSGGERQRVALARALICRPKVFLLDEPLSHLDPSLRGRMRLEIARLHHQLGSTMLYVTHDQLEAMTMGNRIAVMNQGVLQQVGEPLEVYRHPANLFVAGFLGSPPMNFFPGQLTGSDRQLRFQETPDQPSEGPDAGHPLDIALGPELSARLQRQAGRPVILGLRPEAFHLLAERDKPHDEPTVTGQVRHLEPIGHETHAHLTTAYHPFTVRLPEPLLLRRDQQADFQINLQKAHFFEPSSGRALQ